MLFEIEMSLIYYRKKDRRLNQKEQDLDRREEELKQRERELDQREQDLNEKEAEFHRKEEELATKSAAIQSLQSIFIETEQKISACRLILENKSQSSTENVPNKLLWHELKHSLSKSPRSKLRKTKADVFLFRWFCTTVYT